MKWKRIEAGLYVAVNGKYRIQRNTTLREWDFFMIQDESWERSCYRDALLMDTGDNLKDTKRLAEAIIQQHYPLELPE